MDDTCVICNLLDLKTKGIFLQTVKTVNNQQQSEQLQKTSNIPMAMKALFKKLTKTLNLKFVYNSFISLPTYPKKPWS